jgi:hypothetical protein
MALLRPEVPCVVWSGVFAERFIARVVVRTTELVRIAARMVAAIHEVRPLCARVVTRFRSDELLEGGTAACCAEYAERQQKESEGALHGTHRASSAQLFAAAMHVAATVAAPVPFTVRMTVSHEAPAGVGSPSGQ